MRIRCNMMIVICALLAGCATKPQMGTSRFGYAADGAVSGELVDVPGDMRYPRMQGVEYSGALPVRGNGMPEYPQPLLDRRLPPIQLRAQVIVGGDGRVERVVILDNPGAEPAFAEAVLTALERWTYMPLIRLEGDKREPLPFTLEYRFSFRQENGRAVVEANQGSSRGAH